MKANTFRKKYELGVLDDTVKLFYFTAELDDIFLYTTSIDFLYHLGTLDSVFRSERDAAIFAFNRLYENGLSICKDSGLVENCDVAYIILIILKKRIRQ